MKFNTFDELIGFLYGKDLSKLEFDIKDTSECAIGDGSCTVPDPRAVVPQQPSTVGVTFNSLASKPVLEFETADKSYLVVSEFEHIPNTCSTTKIELAGSELMLGVCENEDGLPVAKFDVIINEKLYSSKEFILVTDSQKYKNTISID